MPIVHTVIKTIQRRSYVRAWLIPFWTQHFRNAVIPELGYSLN